VGRLTSIGEAGTIGPLTIEYAEIQRLGPVYQDHEVEVPSREGRANPGLTGKKSDRSADASGVLSQAPFSLPKQAPGEQSLKKRCCPPGRKPTGNDRDKAGAVISGNDVPCA
jgi:hypothetical protein